MAGERLTRLVRGASATRGVAAYVRRQSGATLTERERVLADELEATLEAMFLLAAVDGQVGADEITRFTRSVDAIFDARAAHTAPHTAPHPAPHPEDAASRADVDGLLVRLATNLERDGWTARLHAVAARLETPEARAFAFRLAAGLVLVDDHVAHSEAAALRTLAAALDLDGAAAQHIIEDVQEALAGG